MGHKRFKLCRPRPNINSLWAVHSSPQVDSACVHATQAQTNKRSSSSRRSCSHGDDHRRAGPHRRCNRSHPLLPLLHRRLGRPRRRPPGARVRALLWARRPLPLPPRHLVRRLARRPPAPPEPPPRRRLRAPQPQASREGPLSAPWSFVMLSDSDSVGLSTCLGCRAMSSRRGWRSSGRCWRGRSTPSSSGTSRRPVGTTVLNPSRPTRIRSDLVPTNCHIFTLFFFYSLAKSVWLLHWRNKADNFRMHSLLVECSST